MARHLGNCLCYTLHVHLKDTNLNSAILSLPLLRALAPVEGSLVARRHADALVFTEAVILKDRNQLWGAFAIFFLNVLPAGRDPRVGNLSHNSPGSRRTHKNPEDSSIGLAGKAGVSTRRYRFGKIHQ